VSTGAARDRNRPTSQFGVRVEDALARALAQGEISHGDFQWALSRLRNGLAGNGRGALSPDRIEAFIRAAARVFRRRGFDGANVEEIAAELGVAKGAIYHYFKSKRELFDAVCVGGAADVGEAVEAAAATPGSAEERLRAMLSTYADVQGRDPSIGVLVRSESELSHEAHRHLLVTRQALRGLFVEVLKEGNESGEFEIADANLGMKFVLGGLAWVNSWLDLEPEVRRVMSATVINTALRGVLKRGATEASTVGSPSRLEAL